MKLLAFILLFSLCEIASSQVLKLSTTSYQFLEGPVWDGKRALYLSDQNAGKVYKYVPGTGFSAIRSGELTNGMVYDRSGFLYVCEMGTSNRIIQMDTLGIFQKVVANTHNNKAFNRPNDLCRDKKGGIYFSDPTWGILNQDKQSVYYIKPSGEVIRISGDFQKPNGLCLSLDGNLLYVDDWSDKYVYVFDVQADGTAINKRIFFTLQTSPGQTGSGADGMKIDSQGTLYIATSTGIQVIDKNGNYLKTISVPETPSNVAFGGKDLKTLFITAGTSLYSTIVEISGNPLTSAKTLREKSSGIYPNPTSGIVQTNLPQIKNVKVYNLSGNLMLEQKADFADGAVNLSTLPNGCYILNIENSESVLSEKIIVRK